MQAVFEYSWALLGPRERAIFRSLSVFKGGFSRDAAAKVFVPENAVVIKLLPPIQQSGIELPSPVSEADEVEQFFRFGA